MKIIMSKLEEKKKEYLEKLESAQFAASKGTKRRPETSQDVSILKKMTNEHYNTKIDALDELKSYLWEVDKTDSVRLLLAGIKLLKGEFESQRQVEEKQIATGLRLFNQHGIYSSLSKEEKRIIRASEKTIATITKGQRVNVAQIKKGLKKKGIKKSLTDIREEVLQILELVERRGIGSAYKLLEDKYNIRNRSNQF